MPTDLDFVRGDPKCHYKALMVDAQTPVDPDAAVDSVVYLSTDRVDSDGEVLIPSGCDFSRFNKNPVLFLNHAPSSPAAAAFHPLPVGRVAWTKVRPHGILGGIVFARNTDMARDVKGLWDERCLQTVSVGFIPIESSPMTREEANSRPDWQAEFERRKGKILIHRRYLLLELSIVGIPANEDAVRVKYKSKGLSLPAWLQLPTPGTSTMPEATEAAVPGGEIETKAIVDGAWDAGAARARIAQWASSDGSGDKDKIDWSKYGRAFLYCDESNREEMGSYKFPVADIRDGKFVIVREAIRAAASRLASADIPEEAKAKVREAIARHEKEAGIGEDKKPAEKSHKCPDDHCDGQCKDMEDGDGMDTMSLKPGDHVMHTKAGCGTLKSIHDKGMMEGYGGPLEANTANPIGKVEMHDDKCMGTGTMKAFPMSELKPHTGEKAMAEGSGTAGGYTTKPDEDKAAEPPIDDDTHPGEDEPDGDYDADDMDEAGGFKRGDHVRMKAPHYKGVGVIHSMHQAGHVPNVDEDIKATKDAPAARVRCYKAYGDGHMATEHHVGVECKHLTHLPEDLKAPTKPMKAAEPAPVRKGAKATAEPGVKPLPPLVALSDQQLQQMAAKQIQAIPKMVQDAIDRITGVV